MFFDLIRKRRSKRKFLQKPVDMESIDRLVEAALRSPSSRGFNPWRFIVVDDPEILEKISSSKPHGASFLKDAPLGIAVLADTDQSDVWVEDTSIASIFIQLAAESLGLGSCWIQIRRRNRSEHQSASDYIKKVLNIPENMEVESVIAVGHPAESKPGHDAEDLQMNKVFYNQYEQPYNL